MKAPLIASVSLLALLSIAQAADLPTFEPVQPLPLFTWTGFYAGTFLGYGSVRGRATQTCVTSGPVFCDTIPGADRPNADGFVGGSQFGYNYQLPMGLLFGVEGDYQFTRLRGFDEAFAVTQPFGPGSPQALGIVHVGQSLDDLGTIRGRIGYAFGRTLLYATGGLAFGDVRLDATRADDFDFGSLNNTASRSTFRTGYVVGGGLEYAFSDHLSAKLEGMRFDLGRAAVSATDDAGFNLARGARVRSDGYLMRAGLNFHFGDDLPLAGVLRGVFSPEEDRPAAPTTTWSFESGLRYFYSSGGYRKNLFDNFAQSQLNSRLTFKDASANAAESFARVDHNPTGLFIKGYVGSGGFSSGRLNDEDFPPGLVPYSNTLSGVHNGDIRYANVDVGYNFWRDEAVNMGAFVGYSYLAETMNAFGCSQVGGGDICSTPIASNVKALSEDAVWNALRVGGLVETKLDRFTLSAEAAYLPLVELSAYDHHWLRPDINPLRENGTGTGYQLEMLLSYDVTRDLSLGVGGRYSLMQATHGAAAFPASPQSPLKTQTDRYGGFLQASYKFQE